jgi:hypothetical protein
MATTKTDPKLAISADRARKGKDKDYEGLTREKLIEAYRIMYTSRKIDDREILLNPTRCFCREWERPTILAQAGGKCPRTGATCG